jgi:hypothetical protein
MGYHDPVDAVLNTLTDEQRHAVSDWLTSDVDYSDILPSYAWDHREWPESPDDRHDCSLDEA